MLSEVFNPQNYQWNPWAIPMLGVALLVFLEGFGVYIKNTKALTNKMYGLWLAFVTIWLLGIGMTYLSKQAEIALFWYKNFSFLGVAFITLGSYLFSLSFLINNLSKQGIVILSFVLTSGIFYLVNIYTNWIVKGMHQYFWGLYPIYNLGGIIFLLFWGALYILTIINLNKAYKQAEMSKKKQMLIILWGTVFGYSGAVDYISTFGIEIYPFGYLPVFSYLTLVAYTIIRYRLFEIDTVIHRTFLWLITLLLVILPIGLAVTFSFDWIASLSRLAKLSLTSAVLIFFVWYYSRLKPRIDHLFRRRKYDYYQVLGEIGQKIGSELDINNVVNRLFKELKEVLYIRNGLALVQQPGQENYTEAGSIGYDTLIESQKSEKTALTYQNPLSQWLTTHQKALEREQVEVDPQYEPIKQEALTFLTQNSIEILIPVVMEGKVNALVGIGKKENLQAYTIRDIELLENMGRQIGITIDNALHHEDIVEKERLAEELKLGREIQMNLLPREIPKIRGLTLQGLMQPAKEIGGDYYDFITLAPAQGEAGRIERLAIVIGDVSGKGVAAGLLMAMAKTAIHTLSQEETSPKQILLRTNQILSQHIGGQKFMTLLYFIWQPQTKTLIYSSAGHEHILVYRATGLPVTSDQRPVTQYNIRNTQYEHVESILSGGFMLGMMPDISNFLEDKQITLKPGDKVILYTDGVTEARNPQEDFFGLQKLIQSVEKHGSKPTNELLQSLKDEVYSFIGTREQYDDITLVVMEAV